MLAYLGHASIAKSKHHCPATFHKCVHYSFLPLRPFSTSWQPSICIIIAFFLQKLHQPGTLKQLTPCNQTLSPSPLLPWHHYSTSCFEIHRSNTKIRPLSTGPGIKSKSQNCHLFRLEACFAHLCSLAHDLEQQEFEDDHWIHPEPYATVSPPASATWRLPLLPKAPAHSSL